MDLLNAPHKSENGIALSRQQVDQDWAMAKAAQASKPSDEAEACPSSCPTCGQTYTQAHEKQEGQRMLRA